MPADCPSRSWRVARGFTRAWPRHGTTLLELLAVIAILSMLLAFSAMAYRRMSKSFQQQGAAAGLELVLRQARHSAVTDNAPAFVEIDAPNHRAIPWHCQNAGQWHFEKIDGYGRSPGAYHTATLRGAESVNDGKIGKGILLRPNSCIDLGAEADYDCEDGGCLEASLRLMPGDGNSPSSCVFSKEGAYALTIETGGVLSGTVGSVHLMAGNYRLSPGRWFKVALAWDAFSTRILVDDCIVARAAGARPPVTDHPLLVGHASGSLFSLVDEVRVMSVSAGKPLELPPQAQITHTAAPWNAIYFSADGALDLRYHPGPVSVTVTQDGKQRTVTVSMLGATALQDAENVPQPDTN